MIFVSCGHPCLRDGWAGRSDTLQWTNFVVSGVRSIDVGHQLQEDGV